MIDFTPTYIASQVFFFLGYILLAMTYFSPTRYKLLLTIIAGNFALCVGFGLLGGWIAVSMCGIEICRDTVSFILNERRPKSKKNKITKTDWWLLALWISLITAATAITQKGFLTLFAYFATLTFTISVWQKNLFVYRFLGIFVVTFWIVYNISVKNVMGLALGFVRLIFAISGLVPYYKKLPINKALKI